MEVVGNVVCAPIAGSCNVSDHVGFLLRNLPFSQHRKRNCQTICVTASCSELLLLSEDPLQLTSLCIILPKVLSCSFYVFQLFQWPYLHFDAFLAPKVPDRSDILAETTQDNKNVVVECPASYNRVKATRCTIWTCKGDVHESDCNVRWSWINFTAFS